MRRIASSTLMAAMSTAMIVDANSWTRDLHIYGWRGPSSVFRAPIVR